MMPRKYFRCEAKGPARLIMHGKAYELVDRYLRALERYGAQIAEASTKQPLNVAAKEVAGRMRRKRV